MKIFIALLVCGILISTSCKKDTVQKTIVGQWTWTIQYANNPANNSTPQSSGNNEIFLFNANGSYSLTQNNIAVNTGTYKISSATSTNGLKVSSALFTNQRVTDSVAYYSLNNDSLFFSYDLIGTVGSGSRHYGR